MTQRKWKLTSKIMGVNFILLLVSLLVTYVLSMSLYEELYVKYIESTQIARMEKIEEQYKNGFELEELREKIEWLYSVSEVQGIVVKDFEELNARCPFGVGCDEILSDDEIRKLSNGDMVIKTFVDHQFAHEIFMTLQPLVRDEESEGIIVSYKELDSLNELAQKYLIIWFMTALIFIIFGSMMLKTLLDLFVEPLQELKVAAKKVAVGDYSTIVQYVSLDEVDRFISAFNKMSISLQEEETLRKEFIADLSHEFRTPLSYIKGYTHVLLDGIVKEPANERKYLKLIDRESKKLEDLVQNLLDLTKLESQKFYIQMQPIVFSQCIEDVVEKCSAILHTKKLRLQMDLDPEIIINSDEKRLKQMIHHILENAIRYSLDGELIHVSLYKRKKQCVLEIVDNGIGMSESDLLKVTQKFYRVNKSRTRMDGGSGIGLSLVEKLMTLHGGEMFIESQLEVGTKVCLIFPIYQEK